LMGLLKLTRLPELTSEALNFKNFLERIHCVQVRFWVHTVYFLFVSR
jgi:hypothetical protein